VLDFRVPLAARVATSRPGTAPGLSREAGTAAARPRSRGIPPRIALPEEELDNGSGSAPPRGRALAALSLGALGVVYGDIGTSPLYALKECFGPHLGLVPDRANVLGVLSLIFWSLNLVISFKYLTLLLRADNRGEGGVIALLALLRPRSGAARGVRAVLIMLGVFGTALIYGDGLITPVISTLGAMEGISVIAPGLSPWVPWLSLAILIGLFVIQRWGTAGIGRLWGPITAVWFVSIALWGLLGIVREPSVLAAVNPWHAVAFFAHHGDVAFLVLGAVVLVVTGGEALYADMGHFGTRPIRLMWFAVVLPALLLNYFGQGALLLENPAAASNPFFNLVPEWARYGMLVVATGAAITASQAMITGAFSLTRQAIQLGYLPRLTIRHTSHAEEGQIYVPEINWALMVGCAVLVIGFQSTAAIAGAYGIAVTGTFVITSLLFSHVLMTRWGWPFWKVALLSGPLLLMDLSFFGANVPKIAHGGWVPLAVATVVFVLMTTWKRGREILTTHLREVSLPLDLFTKGLDARFLHRVPGTAVFMTSDPTGAPPVLLHHMKHNKVLHERVVVMSFLGQEVPYVPVEEQIEVAEFGEGVWQVSVYYGFMQTPSMREVIPRLAAQGLEVRAADTSFYLGRETLLPTGTARMSGWRKRLFILMSQNARSAAAYFELPPNRVVELGAQIQL
jgi:KUP system potassium uptake protein